MKIEESTKLLKLITEIISDLENDKIALSTALLKSKRIYLGMANKELEEFVKLETEGNFTEENLPEYRKKYAEPIGVFQHYITGQIDQVVLQYSQYLEKVGLDPDIVYHRPIPFTVSEMEDFLVKAETNELMIEFTPGQLEIARKYLKEDESNGWILKSGYFKLGYSTFTQILNIIKDRFVEILLNLESDLNGKVSPHTEQFFEDGKPFDALFTLSDKIKSAKREILLIDGYIDENSLRLLANKGTTISLKILTHSKSLNDNLKVFIESFNNQYHNLLIKTSNAFHDRFLVIDSKDFYHIGASIKDAGKKSFMLSLIEEKFIQDAVLDKFNKEWNKENGS